MNIDDVEDQQQLLPKESFTDAAVAVAVAAASEDSIQDFEPSTLQDNAEADDSSNSEEVPDSYGDNSGCDNEELPVFEGGPFDDDDEESPITAIKNLYPNTEMTQSQSTSDLEENERSLPDDTFSFLIYTKFTSLPFLLGVIVFLFQVCIYAVLFGNIYDHRNKKNPFGFPFNVSASVRISEVLAIFISIITQQDMRSAICLYRDGFDKNGLTRVFKKATLCKWTCSIVLRATEGILGLIITFLLIMRSDSVLELLLNFSAIEFVTDLDDLVFKLARQKFLGKTVKDEARRVVEKSYYVNQDCANKESAKRVSIAYFVVLCASFFAGWGTILKKQRDGAYLCQLIFSQFGDELIPELGTFTGLFYKHSKTFGGKSSYRGEDIYDEERGPLLAYCETEKRWTLSLTKDGTKADEWNPCVDWKAASSESESESGSFDLLSTTSSPWVINATTNRAAPLTHHFLACYECSNVDDFCGDYGQCVLPEEAEFDRCLCDGSHYGLRCEYSRPCETLEVYQRDDFPKEDGGQFASKYYRLAGAEP